MVPDSARRPDATASHRAAPAAMTTSPEHVAAADGTASTAAMTTPDGAARIAGGVAADGAGSNAASTAMRAPGLERPTSRRWFLRTLGAATVALPLAPLVPAAAQTAGGATATAPAPLAVPATPAPTESEFAADARTLAELVERRFGSRLTAAEKDAVRGDLQDGLESGRVLRNLDLTNADEPDVVFRALGLED